VNPNSLMISKDMNALL